MITEREESAGKPTNRESKLPNGKAMNREDIIRMAREAGGADITSHGWTSWVGTQSTEFLERFATLVAAHGREKPVQVSPLEFVTAVLEKEHLVGKPIMWAQWPNEEKNHD